MQSITNLFLSGVDLVEAEGRTLKNIVIKVAICLACFVLAVFFVIGGYVAGMFGIYFALALVMKPFLAALLTGLASIVLGGAIGLAGYELVRK